MNNHPLKKGNRIADVARQLTVRYETVRQWTLVGDVPLKHLAAVVAITGIPPRQLSPGLYACLDAVDSAWSAMQSRHTILRQTQEHLK